MATKQEIKDAKRADLDALAVEQGLDPAAFATAPELRKELLKTASDAGDDDQNDEDDDADAAPDKGATAPTKDEAEAAAKDAEKAKQVATTVPPLGHASSFDKNGQPIFGKKKGE